MAKQTFTSGQVLTAAQVNALQANDYNQTVSTKTASYTLVAADAGTKIVMNSASATTITVNTSLFAAGDTLTLLNIGAGVCTITAGTATVSSNGSLALAQYGGGILYFTSTGVSVFQASGVSNPLNNSVTAKTSGAQSTTSTSFTGLATATSVTVTTGTSALVVATATLGSSTVNTSNQMGYAISGATTAGATTGDVARFNQSNAATFMGATVTIFEVRTGLTAGSNTFTLQYALNIAGTMDANDRRITVFPL